MTDTGTTTGLVLAAGSSERLGRPKQLLAYRGRTLLDATLDVARECGFGQMIVTLGGSAVQVRERVDLDGFVIVDNVHHTSGCSSSIVAALEEVAPECESIVLLLGDQPGIDPQDVALLGSTEGDIGVCRYTDGIGHPFRFRRATFGALGELHGDKGVWKLIESGRFRVEEIAVDRTTPRDVDTEDDYRALLEACG